MNVMREDILACCGTMNLHEEIYDNVFYELDRMTMRIKAIRYIVLKPNDSDNIFGNNDDDLMYPHVVQPSTFLKKVYYFTT